MSAGTGTCPRCAAAVGPTDKFCEGCGAPLAEVRRVAVPRALRTLGAPAGPCADCGNQAYVDEYCTACGHRRPEPDRDQMELAGIVLVTDRGIEHVRNEDAAAAGIVGEPPHALAVAVCDGVSTSGEAHTAAVAASKAGVDAMLATLAATRKGRAAVLTGLAGAAKAAVAAGAGADPSSAPSCTYTAAAVVPAGAGTVEITIGNVGDSRAYWLPEPPAAARQLTVDDSLAQELMTAGASADSAAVQRSAHTLTRWLGADADAKPWSDSSVQTITATGPGALLMCTDGLWNYLPDAADIAPFCAGADAVAAAVALVEHALRAGGQDNITVAVIPIGGLHEFT
ncbi:MAG: protein phosphatase 2C domain-containing protein [Actinobacteria bacterium]|nr:protein phosphatase 2C domain-containing protein [Actinomycetota bacterium]